MIMWPKVKKIVLSSSIIVLFALYALQKQAQPAGQALHVAALAPSATSVAVGRPPSTAIAAFARVSPSVPAPVRPTPPAGAALTKARSTQTPRATATATVPAPTATASGAYRDGSYAGSQADANWGTVQVLAVITNGQISDVQFSQFPNHRNRSKEINSQAMPLLTQEAIQSQQAQVDVVSGATDTSDAFIQSLASALSQAAS